MELLRGHARVWLSQPLSVQSLISDVQTNVEEKKSVCDSKHFLYLLPDRHKNPSESHLHMVVGRIQLQDDTKDGSMFEYGITDFIEGSRREDAYNMYVHACGPRASTSTNSDLCKWFLNELIELVGDEYIVSPPKCSTFLRKKKKEKNEKLAKILRLCNR